jgi:hypothetical protein
MFLQKDDIVQLTYWRRSVAPVDIVMREASKMLSSYLATYAVKNYHGQDQLEPEAAIEHFRKQSRQMMEQHGEPVTIHAQAGNKESQEYIRKLQSAPDFLRWDNPYLAQALLEFNLTEDHGNQERND